MFVMVKIRCWLKKGFLATNYLILSFNQYHIGKTTLPLERVSEKGRTHIYEIKNHPGIFNY